MQRSRRVNKKITVEFTSPVTISMNSLSGKMKSAWMLSRKHCSTSRLGPGQVCDTASGSSPANSTNSSWCPANSSMMSATSRASNEWNTSVNLLESSQNEAITLLQCRTN